ncbi:MAG: VOC family protein [Agarilytica sp.]
MPENKQINYVEFAAKDLAASQAFFEKAFGWQFQSWGDDYLSFSHAGLDGGFYRSEKYNDCEAGGALIVLYASELEATLAEVRAAKGKISKEIFPFPGGRRFHFIEPSGNELAVWSDK